MEYDNMTKKKDMDSPRVASPKKEKPDPVVEEKPLEERQEPIPEPPMEEEQKEDPVEELPRPDPEKYNDLKEEAEYLAASKWAPTVAKKDVILEEVTVDVVTPNMRALADLLFPLSQIQGPLGAKAAALISMARNRACSFGAFVADAKALVETLESIGYGPFEDIKTYIASLGVGNE
jgi:hypothetical protein